MANKARTLPSTFIVAIVFAVVAGTGIFFWAQRVSNLRNQPIVLTPEAKAYVRNLKIIEMEMKAKESYMQQAVVEIVGKIRNDGDRPLNVVEIYCSFYDSVGQLVLREKVPIVSAKMGGLKPGEVKPFRLPFDTIPESWNQTKPNLVIAQIQFAN